MKKKKTNGVKGTFIFLILLCLILGYYFYLSNRSAGGKEEEEVKTTATQEILLRDMEKNYPATPKEVVKYYSELTKCFYNEEHSEEELKKLSERAMEMYDSDLAANQNDEYENNLKQDIIEFNQSKIQISSYRLSNSTDVEYFYTGGRECASLYSTFTLRKGTELFGVEEQFILRRDEDGHWKILGWKEKRLEQ